MLRRLSGIDTIVAERLGVMQSLGQSIYGAAIAASHAVCKDVRLELGISDLTSVCTEATRALLGDYNSEDDGLVAVVCSHMQLKKEKTGTHWKIGREGRTAGKAVQPRPDHVTHSFQQRL